MNNSPIIIVEDDKEDCEFLTEALQNIGVKNEFKCFQTPIEALQYLKATHEKTFLIISDVNMPLMNGMEFKKSIQEDSGLSSRKIPFIFLSTSATQSLVNEAFSLDVQGYFQKPNNLDALKNLAKFIVDYWRTSKLPDMRN